MILRAILLSTVLAGAGTTLVTHKTSSLPSTDIAPSLLA